MRTFIKTLGVAIRKRLSYIIVAVFSIVVAVTITCISFTSKRNSDEETIMRQQKEIAIYYLYRTTVEQLLVDINNNNRNISADTDVLSHYLQAREILDSVTCGKGNVTIMSNED